ncbi:MAG: FKBP-type peptidyl-prolyl cis-trans isomerase [Bacteroidales bacterium]|jgi:FKBP-type peptidyl-prolyl cis-trans isomerase|nr:FKBP-type peptidyl-prolyl cis-trans isomerase [Bacteroidales bacterium]
MKPSLAFAILLSVTLFSCSKEEENSVYDSQETRISTFIDNQLESDTTYSVVYNEKATRLIVKEGEGDQLSSSGTISFFYAGYAFTGTTINSDNLFATNDKETADGIKWALSDSTAFNVLTINLSDSDLIEGLKSALPGVRSGEECYILFSGKYGYGKHKVGTIPAKCALAYHIRVESINNE